MKNTCITLLVMNNTEEVLMKIFNYFFPIIIHFSLFLQPYFWSGGKGLNKIEATLFIW